MSRRNLSVLFAALAIGLLCYSRADRNPYARYTSRAFELIDDLALEEPPDDELFAGAVRGMVGVLRQRGDVHSGYLEPTSAEPLRAEMRQEFGGVGVRVGLEGDPPRVTVVEPPQPGTPAYASPIRARDVILSIDGFDTEGADLATVVGHMRGPVGEPVEVAVRHADTTEESFRLVREVIRVPSVIGDRRTAEGGWLFPLEEEPRVALVRLTTFGNRTTEELERTLREAIDSGVEAVVLDVRLNAGGALDTAIGVTGLFLPEGAAIVSTRGRGGRVVDRFAATADGPFLDLPLAVLIDGDTASASEIVAAALQDHDRATVFGSRSFGKGTVQQLLSLEAGRSLLKLTAASYWRPSGVNIHRLPGTPDDEPWGVSPKSANAVSLTDEQRTAWFEWRRQRDLLAVEGAEPAEPPAPAPLEADTILTRAVEHLLEGMESAQGDAAP
ncbi:putative CtpA-like serine protease [Planctomycetes bacterium MalM25]|nr:putative CtpA-like serine protease [Planctomycetes bacterium MalM25]